MYEPLKIGAWVIVDSNCPMRILTDEDGDVTFVFGNGRDDFELALDTTALRKLLELGSQILTQLDQ